MNIDELLKQIKRVHFIGIGGAGMCPLAEILHHEGYELSGSDNNESDTLRRIRALGIPVAMGQRAENVDGAEMVIYTAALLPDNPELVAAREKGIPTFERAKLFGAISRRYPNTIGICGTHGKTTVTAMTVQTAMTAGLDPSALIGGRLPMINANGRVGASEYFICEACEFKDHFLELSPRCAVILNIDNDHMEYFKTMENMKASYTKFADMADTVIYNGDDANTLDAVRAVSAGKTLISYGRGEGNDWSAAHITMNRGAFPEFDILYQGTLFTHVKLSVPGSHNVYNALACAAAAHYAGADADGIRRGVESFTGAGRRFEILYDKNGITVADDYAHHPTELEATIDTALKMEYDRVWAVFQPFTYSRTYMLMDDFARVLSKADKCVLTEIMGSREINTYGVSAEQLRAKIPGAALCDFPDGVADYLYANVQPGDLVLTLGCGDVYKAAKQLVKKYEARG
ncbi:MAG: UDP-N-acetylmuramate--L-alanine ligase [Clostridia bacterium]|nr:UDP-N-acetylmuramate--L-alanine ligase [Clostridia bacterium]